MIWISEAHNEARLAGTLAFLDTGAANARIRIYDGTRPAGGGTATLLLVEIELSKPCGAIDNGLLTLASTDLPIVLNSGEATWARIVNGDGAAAIDCDVSASGGAGEVQLPDTTLLAGSSTSLASGVFG